MDNAAGNARSGMKLPCAVRSEESDKKEAAYDGR